jgi:hypothetical protein
MGKASRSKGTEERKTELGARAVRRDMRRRQSIGWKAMRAKARALSAELKERQSALAVGDLEGKQILAEDARRGLEDFSRDAKLLK